MLIFGHDQHMHAPQVRSQIQGEPMIGLLSPTIFPRHVGQARIGDDGFVLYGDIMPHNGQFLTGAAPTRIIDTGLAIGLTARSADGHVFHAIELLADGARLGARGTEYFTAHTAGVYVVRTQGVVAFCAAVTMLLTDQGVAFCANHATRPAAWLSADGTGAFAQGPHEHAAGWAWLQTGTAVGLIVDSVHMVKSWADFFATAGAGFQTVGTETLSAGAARVHMCAVLLAARTAHSACVANRFPRHMIRP